MLIGVVGLGTIGIKLVEYLAEKKIHVIAYNFRNIEKKQSEFIENIEKKVKYNRISFEVFEQIIKRVDFTTNLNDLHEVDLVIESTKERYETKQKIYIQLKSVLKENAILASTTSSLSLEKLGGFFSRDRFLGIHFFNPPTKMKLIELSFLKENVNDVKQRIYKFLSSFDDKKVIELPPIQGYIVNNLLFNYINFAIEFFYTSKINAQDIDEAMKLGTNVPMGPLELSDYIGNDITLQILQELYSETQDRRFMPHQTLIKMVEDGFLGRKTKQGFYFY